ncbi:MAG: YbaK/EbsC family protein [Acidimicrobiia bacterium]|nr:YbaK/EbsC family protein [Acidimicrobiia bacterium]
MAPSDAVERFLAAARSAGLDDLEVQRFPHGTRTAADAAAAVGCAVDQIVKSLVLEADDRAVLVLCSGSRRVDTDALAEHLDATHVAMASADQVRSATGFAIGGTPPLGHPEPLDTLIDPHLLGFDVVYAAAGTPDSVFAVAPGRLAEVAAATPARVTG